MNRVYSAFTYDFNSLPPFIRWMCAAVTAVFLAGWFFPEPVYRALTFSPYHFVEKLWLWQIVTYGVVAHGFWSLVIVLLVLVFFGSAVERQWGTGELLRYLLLCYAATALALLALMPGVKLYVGGADWVGYWLVLAFAMLHPDATVYFFLIPVRAVYLVVLAVLGIYFANGTMLPGHARFAPLIGMFCGWLYIRYSGEWWITLKHRWVTLFHREPAPRRYAPRRPAPSRPAPPPDDGMAEVDHILDKILASGLDSLTEDEKLIMKRYSDKGRKPS